MANGHYLYPAKAASLFSKLLIKNSKCKGKTDVFKKGDFICRPGDLSDSVYLVKKGHVQIFHIRPEGKECVLGILSEGDLIDLLQVFSEKESQLFARALY